VIGIHNIKKVFALLPWRDCANELPEFLPAQPPLPVAIEPAEIVAASLLENSVKQRSNHCSARHWGIDAPNGRYDAVFRPFSSVQSNFHELYTAVFLNASLPISRRRRWVDFSVLFSFGHLKSLLALHQAHANLNGRPLAALFGATEIPQTCRNIRLNFHDTRPILHEKD
jgi:hypothetical protein